MEQTPAQYYQNLLSEVIKKQIVILGPDITLTKARKVIGLSVADDGSVIQMDGNPNELTQKLVDQFMELSGQIVKKTMEPLLHASSNAPSGVTLPQIEQKISVAEIVPSIQPQPQHLDDSVYKDLMHSLQTPTPEATSAHQTAPVEVSTISPASPSITIPTAEEMHQQPLAQQPTQNTDLGNKN